MGWEVGGDHEGDTGRGPGAEGRGGRCSAPGRYLPLSASAAKAPQMRIGAGNFFATMRVGTGEVTTGRGRCSYVTSVHGRVIGWMRWMRGQEAGGGKSWHPKSA